MKRRSLLKPPSTGSASAPRPTAACPRLEKPSPISPAQKISISRTLPKRFSTGAWIEKHKSPYGDDDRLRLVGMIGIRFLGPARQHAIDLLPLQPPQAWRQRNCA